MSGDSEITGRIRQGDLKVFESLFRSSFASLVRYARVLIKDQDTAEEIVQDLFVKIWQERKNLAVTSSLNGYLFRSVHNRCIHHIEHLKVRDKYSEEISKLQPELMESPADQLQYAELQNKIARIIEKLPERCGRIFLMNRFEGLKYSEIAEKLSVSVKTVEANMGRALKEFRKELSDYERS